MAAGSGIGRLLLRMFGCSYETRKPPPCGSQAASHEPACDRSGLLPDDCAASVESSRWKLDKTGLKAGWYMLEIEHSVQSIGCILTLEGAAGLREQLLLTSKPVCKRIVRLETAQNALSITIDQADCVLERLTMTRLTSSFALSRIRTRLIHRGCISQVTSGNARVLYAEYQSHVNGAIHPSPYRSGDRVANLNGESKQSASDLQHPVKLLLHPVDDGECESARESIRSAMTFARRRGWDVAWQPAASMRFDSTEKCSDRHVFHMPIPVGVRCRAELFHEMLSAIDEQSLLVYADHDHVDVDNVRSNPNLKPEWNPELLLNTNYIQFPWMVSASWASRLDLSSLHSQRDFHDQVLLSASLGVHVSSAGPGNLPGAMNDGTGEPADAARWITPPLADHQVKRVAKILASLEKSSVDENTDVLENSVRWTHSLRVALSRAGVEAQMDPGSVAGFTHVLWPLPDCLPSVDIVIPTRDKADVLKVCIDSILDRTLYPAYRIVLVDNDSVEQQTADYYRTLDKEPRIELLQFPGPFNYSAINNHAVAAGDSPIVVLLNNDTEVISPGWLEEMVRQVMRPETGCVGAKLYYTNGRIQHGGVIVGITGVAGHAHRYSPGHAPGYCGRLLASQNLTAVTAACLAVRREVYRQAGGLDQLELGVAWNDVDLCMKVRSLGYRNLWTPHAMLYHHEGLSRGADDTPDKVRRADAERQVMMTRWALDSFEDPAYHPLLARDNESFSLGK